MIGNASDARLIRDYVATRAIVQDEYERYGYGAFIGPVRPRMTTPEGWRKIGGGSFRSAWLSPEGVVYKVQHHYNGWGQSNGEEYANIVVILQKHKSHPLAFMPRSTYYTLDDNRGVMAMEFIKGEHPGWCNGCSGGYGHCTVNYEGKCINRILREIGEAYGLFDLHDENVIWLPEQRKFAVIDIGA
ncbi:hypothetical protein SEA_SPARKLEGODDESS_263 [Streptomyces phage SparkleGoddess]|uniref:Protein kinase domain-containing protein n=2 Tax=Gilsonvirus comrade TaxID=2846395 RepID=A0A345MEG1_9CAUD|nr:hypothetical protein SEA_SPARKLEGODDESS_263 [Streptomyces phage SparkleGoddess]QQO39916.1 hypothetical protein SEA_BELFORT_264 [Streptomyces phage Belfort]UTN92485.1 hypothetical protein SEA_STIGMA_261 [Streptomyces phage Stigma]